MVAIADPSLSIYSSYPTLLSIYYMPDLKLSKSETYCGCSYCLIKTNQRWFEETSEDVSKIIIQNFPTPNSWIWEADFHLLQFFTYIVWQKTQLLYVSLFHLGTGRTLKWPPQCLAPGVTPHDCVVLYKRDFADTVKVTNWLILR